MIKNTSPTPPNARDDQPRTSVPQLSLRLGRFFGGVCVASNFFSAVYFSKKIPKSDVKNRPKKRKLNGLVGWGGVLLASAYRGIPRFKRTSGPLFFAPAV